MMADVAAADDIPLSEGGDTLELLVEGMYNANMTISEDNIDACLELARKYDIADMRDNCARFLDCVPLTVHNLPRWLALAEAYDVGTAAQQCQTFVAAGNNFEAMLRYDVLRSINVASQSCHPSLESGVSTARCLLFPFKFKSQHFQVLCW